MNKEYITYNHFLKLNTSQKYFIWNKLPIDKLNNEIDSEENLETFWDFNHQIDIESELDVSMVETRASVFLEVERAFENKITNLYGIENVYVVRSKTTESAIIETKEALLANKYKCILYPVFEYKNAIAKPTLIDLEKNKLSNLKLSTSTKRKDILKPYWDFWITKQSLKIDDISYYLIKINENPIKDAKDFTEIFCINTNKSKKVFTDKQKKELEKTNDLFFYKTLLTQQGITYKEYKKFSNNFRNFDNNLFNIISSRTIEGVSKKDSFFQIIEINDAIEQINEAKKISDYQEISELDNTIFDSNSQFDQLLKISEPSLYGYSGTIFKKDKIIDLINNKHFNSIDNQLQDFYLYKMLKENKILVFKDSEVEKHLENLNNINKRIIWYDFEGFSLPYSPMNGIQPYQQMVFQLSIKETYKGKITENTFDSENVVYDPQKISAQTFVEIITRIYANKADYYVVFNQGYENTRIREMLKIIENEDPKNYLKIKDYVLWIKNNTIDLADFFSGYSEKNKNLPFIFIPELKGFYSIKKIEKYITKHNINLNHLITPYSELEIQNGVSAMSKAIARYIGSIGDKEWNEVKKELKKYCENDVMAMIMVHDFINWIIKKSN
ncbi:DUF2779 domain-containing protein [Mesomycoplasma lagogenitalium]|uniref:DUF2779 domain-containing protein n=1 Tax=Mesomycoplasma lagogenitalium TaxID=171286 RepID=A0ABY8LUY2_9BACT|nr:DUF2779 domain-containing protein [Mesomycoplasma lagogenitalium]WGI37041.1 DUF2779 domain-containing protein [Mesomycoplasma lagogenitalium]